MGMDQLIGVLAVFVPSYISSVFSLEWYIVMRFLLEIYVCVQVYLYHEMLTRCTKR